MIYKLIYKSFFWDWKQVVALKNPKKKWRPSFVSERFKIEKFEMVNIVQIDQRDQIQCETF